MSCTCQDCGNQYKVDLVIPDELWEKIKPMESLKVLECYVVLVL